MNARVDKNTCIGCGLCNSICDKVFEIGSDGKATVIVDKVPSECIDEAKDAEISCPVNAISCDE